MRKTDFLSDYKQLREYSSVLVAITLILFFLYKHSKWDIPFYAGMVVSFVNLTLTLISFFTIQNKNTRTILSLLYNLFVVLGFVSLFIYIKVNT